MISVLQWTGLVVMAFLIGYIGKSIEIRIRRRRR